MITYTPNPVDTSDIEFPPHLEPIREMLAEHVHDIWARDRIKGGWKFGEARDDEARLHPCLVPYPTLPDSEKEYDRNTATETIKLMIKMGFGLVARAD